MTPSTSLDTIVKFSSRKGFVYPGSDIYGGLANTWDYGTKGVMLLENLRRVWKTAFVYERTDMYELDAGILMNQKIWEASGHTAGFSDCLVDDKLTKHRFRADHLIEDQLQIDVEGKTPEEITQIIWDNNLLNPITKKPGDWTEARYMNLMFETNRDKIGKDPTQNIYLRPETAQAIFVQFKNVINAERARVPFGIAQIGKAFRNEITPGNFTFRVIEFEQMEIEYFIREFDWQAKFEMFLALEQEVLISRLGFKSENIKLKEHAPEKLSHYSKRTVDIEYNFPWGFGELWGLAYRTNYDLTQHQEHSKTSLEYQDPETNEKFIPHVIEPSVGLGRLFLATLCEHYREEKLAQDDTRIVLGLPYDLAPYKLSVLPLMKKDGLADKAREIHMNLRKQGIAANYDEAGSIGKRYRREDENGTPWTMCVDYQSLEDDTITLRHRDTMEQIRIPLSELNTKLNTESFRK
jgi:glycyl-tRNA synthetase